MVEQLARESQAPEPCAWALASVGFAAWLEGRWRVSLQKLDAAAELLSTQCAGVDFETSNARFFAVGNVYMLGELAELSRRARILLRSAEQRGHHLHAIAAACSLSTLGWLVNDEVDTVEAVAARSWAT